MDPEPHNITGKILYARKKKKISYWFFNMRFGQRVLSAFIPFLEAIISDIPKPVFNALFILARDYKIFQGYDA